MTFTLDTSGVVEGPISTPDGQRYDAIGWAFLTPFQQGYVEALFASLPHGPRLIHPSHGAGVYVRFQDLSSETLATILRDCEAYCAGHHRQNCHKSEVEGGSFWRTRQAAGYVRDGRFPPLTPYLGDDGRVYLREGV
jgi:hypothetical protein